MAGVILIVDDDADIREALSGVLRDEGLEVEEAATGIQALERIRRDPPVETLLLDWNMRPMSGAMFLEALQKEKRRPRVYVVTADSRIDGRARHFPIAGYLQKPIDLPELFRILGRSWD